MPITTFTSREFSHDRRRAKKAAARGPVFITDRGRPPHVLLSIQEYQRPTQGKRSIIDMLGLPERFEDVAFDILPLSDLRYPADFRECFCSIQTSGKSRQ